MDDWLARRGQDEGGDLEDVEGYEKVLDVYCCEVLVGMGLWEYAGEFLEYESEMRVERREVLFFFFAHFVLMNDIYDD